MAPSAFIFGIIFLIFSVIVGETIHRYGKVLLSHALGSEKEISHAIGALLRIGWYLVASGLLLWNLGVEEASYNNSPIEVQVSLRLGIAIFIQGFLHGLNILALSLFHRKGNSNNSE